MQQAQSAPLSTDSVCTMLLELQDGKVIQTSGWAQKRRWVKFSQHFSTSDLILSRGTKIFAFFNERDLLKTEVRFVSH